jgi:phosphate/sulfate permease
VLNLVGAFLSVEVAKTISSEIVDDTKITPVVIFARLVGAIVWKPVARGTAPAVIATACFAVCAAIVIYLIIA